MKFREFLTDDEGKFLEEFSGSNGYLWSENGEKSGRASDSINLVVSPEIKKQFESMDPSSEDNSES